MGMTTPSQYMEQADAKAQEWLNMPYEQRRKAMSQTQQSDEVLWALSKARMQLLRTQAASEGQQQILSGQAV